MTINVKVRPQFPSQVLSGGGIDVSEANGNFSFALDYTDFPQIGALPTDQTYALIFDPITKQYSQAPISLLGSGGAAVTVANLPVAGTIGRRAFVIDATQAMTAGIGAIVAGSGTNKVPVYDDGTNWRIG